MRQAILVFIACSIIFTAMLITLFSGSAELESPANTEPEVTPVIEERKMVRDVTPEEFLQAPTVSENTLERLPAKEPPPIPPRPKKPEKFSRPIVVSAGVIKSGKRTITLADIELLPLDEKCQTNGTKTWPCGMLARTEMRLFVRGRPLDCDPVENTEKESITTRCRLDGFDISSWLVLTGWATPSQDLFQEELREAKEKKRGIWRSKNPLSADD